MCVCGGVWTCWTYLTSLTHLACFVITFQQLSCDGEGDVLSRDIRKANQTACFDQNTSYETTACKGEGENGIELQTERMRTGYPADT